jgi:predicted TIM-barrel fold metal-dependent hydrolase
MKYNLVSGDSHVDLSWLPGDLFKASAQTHLKDKVPQIHGTPEGPRWLAEGRVLGVVHGAGHGFVQARPDMRRRIKRMKDAGFYDGKPHPIDPELRLNHMALDGIDAEILYGITGTGMRLKDHETIAETYRIYNDWVADFCGTNPGRWYALACVPIHDPNLAAQELRRASISTYVRGADLIASEVTHPIYVRDGYWDPLWQAVADTQAPVSFHVGGGRIPVPKPPDAKAEPVFGQEASQNDLAFQGVTQALGQFSCVQWLIGIIYSGACEKFPNFRFVIGESGAGWIPFALNRMDHIYKDAALDQKFDPPMKLLPSEYWFRQGATTFQEEPCVGQMAHLVGEDNLMWGSDYPHPDGVWPDSREVIHETMGQLPTPVLRKITCDNAVRIYRMGR